MGNPPEHVTRIHDLARLRQGDTVEARRYSEVRYRGVIDTVVPRLDVLWLRHGAWQQDRTLLEAAEYDFWKVTNPQSTFRRLP